jgi:hypothetical protein
MYECRYACVCDVYVMCVCAYRSTASRSTANVSAADNTRMCGLEEETMKKRELQTFRSTNAGRGSEREREREREKERKEEENETQNEKHDNF